MLTIAGGVILAVLILVGTPILLSFLITVYEHLKHDKKNQEYLADHIDRITKNPPTETKVLEEEELYLKIEEEVLSGSRTIEKDPDYYSGLSTEMIEMIETAPPKR